MTEIRVQVKSGARKETVKKLSKGKFAVSIKEKAERNEANRRVQEIFAKMYRIPVFQVRIITGHKSPNKRLRIEDI
ncbi:MAG: DUF167 domain-containing protein [Candidatus Pacebacteria bacterium]|nr:DUF167 domain-containing protein [Candidatus Paceibacterota bacterium]